VFEVVPLDYDEFCHQQVGNNHPVVQDQIFERGRLVERTSSVPPLTTVVLIRWLAGRVHTT